MFCGYIRITCPCGLYPIRPHFNIVKVGCTWVYIFLIFALKHRLWVNEAVLMCTHNQCFTAKIRKILEFFIRKTKFYSHEILLYIHGRVFVMSNI